MLSPTLPSREAKPFSISVLELVEAIQNSRLATAVMEVSKANVGHRVSRSQKLCLGRITVLLVNVVLLRTTLHSVSPLNIESYNSAKANGTTNAFSMNR